MRVEPGIMPSEEQTLMAMGAIRAAVAVCDMRFASSDVIKDRATRMPRGWPRAA